MVDKDIELVKTYWNNRPCNIRHSNKEVGSKEYFDEVEQRKYYVEPHILGFAQFKRWRNKKVLEIGCGIGTDAINFCRAGACYYGIDLSVESIKIAQQRMNVFHQSGTLRVANVEEMVASDFNGKFDLIYSFGVLHHTPNPKQAIKKISSLLEDNGELRIMLYAKRSWKAILIEEGFDQPEAQNGCPIANTYTNGEIEELLRPYFRVMSIEQKHIFPFEIERYKKYEYKLQPWFKVMPREMFEALEKHLGWHLCIVANLVK